MICLTVEDLGGLFKRGDDISLLTFCLVRLIEVRFNGKFLELIFCLFCSTGGYLRSLDQLNLLLIF